MRTCLAQALRSQWVLATFATAIIGILGLITAGLLARILGPGDRGVLAGAMLWSTLIFAACGVPSVAAVTVRWSRAAAAVAQRRVLGASLWLVIGSTLLLVPLCMLVNRVLLRVFDHPGAVAAGDVYLLSLPVGLLAGCFMGVLLGTARHTVFWGARVAGATAYCLALTGLTASGRLTLLWCAGAALVGSCATLLVVGLAFFNREAPLPVSCFREVRRLGSFSITTNAAGLPYQLNMRFDQALLMLLVPSVVLGQYVIAFSWSSIVMLIGSGVSPVLLARSAAAAATRAPAEVEQVFARFRALVWIIGGVAGCAAAAGPLVIPLLFGAAFVPAVTPAVVLCFAAAMLSINLSLHEIARGFGHPGVGVTAEIVGLVVAMTLLLLLARTHGATGAAVAALVGYATSCALLVRGLRRRMGPDLMPRVTPSVADLKALHGFVTGTIRGTTVSQGYG
jgi:O-antigen/teichoic acid export membrane protein